MKSEVIYLYKDRTDVTLTTYVLDDSREMLNGGKRPAVLICPGGAYLSCSDREGEPVAMAFAAMAIMLSYCGIPPMGKKHLKPDSVTWSGNRDASLPCQ